MANQHTIDNPALVLDPAYPETLATLLLVRREPLATKLRLYLAPGVVGWLQPGEEFGYVIPWQEEGRTSPLWYAVTILGGHERCKWVDTEREGVEHLVSQAQRDYVYVPNFHPGYVYLTPVVSAGYYQGCAGKFWTTKYRTLDGVRLDLPCDKDQVVRELGFNHTDYEYVISPQDPAAVALDQTYRTWRAALQTCWDWKGDRWGAVWEPLKQACDEAKTAYESAKKANFMAHLTWLTGERRAGRRYPIWTQAEVAATPYPPTPVRALVDDGEDPF